MYKLRLIENTEHNLQFFSIYFHNIEMFVNKNVKYWKNPIPVFTKLPCDGDDNDEGEGVEVDGSNKDVGLDNVNAGDGKNKIDLGDMYNGGGDSNDDVGVDDVGRELISSLIAVLIEEVAMVMIKMIWRWWWWWCWLWYW